MKKMKWILPVLVAILGIFSLVAGCSSGSGGGGDGPRVESTIPADGATDVDVTVDIRAVFDTEMDPATIVADTFFTVSNSAEPVAGVVSYDAATKTANFAPTANLDGSSLYIATITTGVTSIDGNPMDRDKEWSFTTAGAPPTGGPLPVNLGTASNFAILAKTAVTTVPASAITGDVGISPAALSDMEGFSETLDGTATFATSTQVTGRIYAAGMTAPTPTLMTTAISDMETAYTAAAGTTVPAAVTDLGGGEIGGLTLVPGRYKWGTGLGISTNVTLWGDANAVWIFQIGEELTLANGIQIILSGGALPQNIFWQVGSGASLGTGSHFEGILMTYTAITLATGATMNGRALAQTAVTLQSSTITNP